MKKITAVLTLVAGLAAISSVSAVDSLGETDRLHCSDPYALNGRCEKATSDGYRVWNYICQNQEGDLLRIVAAHENLGLKPSFGKLLVVGGPWSFWNRVITDAVVTEAEAICKEELGGTAPVIINFYETAQPQ